MPIKRIPKPSRRHLIPKSKCNHGSRVLEASRLSGLGRSKIQDLLGVVVSVCCCACLLLCVCCCLALFASVADGVAVVIVGGSVAYGVCSCWCSCW